MTPKVFLILAAITVVTTVGAVFAVLNQPAPTTLQFIDEPAFPDLRVNPDAVAKVTLTTPDGTITLVRETGDRWAALERYGYPVDPQRVRALVVALADMRLIERKTAQPERYDRLEVEGPEAEGAKSRLVRLEAADGAVLAEAIIGKQRSRLTGTEPTGTYLRRPGEPESWLASGGVEIGAAVTDWLDDQIVDLNGRSVARLTIQPAGEPSYTLERAEPGSDLRLADLAEGEAVKEDADFARLTGALSDVRLEDVKPRDQVSWPAESNLAEIRTFDGLEMTVRLAKIEDQYWATFDARALEPTGEAAPTANAVPEDATTSAPETEAQPAQETTAGSASGEETEAAEGDQPMQPATSAQETQAAGADQAEGDVAEGGAAEGGEEVSLEETEAPLDPAELGQRFSKWAYQIPKHLYNRLSTARSEFLKGQDNTS
jgi:hypothetical protein